MTDDQIEDTIDSYYRKCNIVYACVLGTALFVGMFGAFSSLIEMGGDIAFFLFFLIITICAFLVSAWALVFARKQFVSISSVLDEKCDFALFKRMVEYACKQYPSSLWTKTIVFRCCIQVSIMENNMEKAQKLMDNAYYRKVIERDKYYKTVLLLMIALKEEDYTHVEEYFRFLKDYLQQRLVKRKGRDDKRTLAIEDASLEMEAIYASYKKDYILVLTYVDKMKASSLFQKVEIAYDKGNALSALNRYDEAIIEFDFVIANGNTLPYVEYSRKRLLEINQI